MGAGGRRGRSIGEQSLGAVAIVIAVVLCVLALVGAVMISLLFDGFAQPSAERRQVASTDTAKTAEPVGDAPPNYEVNNGWRQRHDVPAESAHDAEQAAKRIRSALTKLHQAGRYDDQQVRATIIELGFAPEQVEVFHPYTEDDPGRKAEDFLRFGVRIAPQACVIGAIDPRGAQTTTGSPIPEWGCLEPYTH